MPSPYCHTLLLFMPSCKAHLCTLLYLSVLMHSWLNKLWHRKAHQSAGLSCCSSEVFCISGLHETWLTFRFSKRWFGRGVNAASSPTAVLLAHVRRLATGNWPWNYSMKCTRRVALPTLSPTTPSSLLVLKVTIPLPLPPSPHLAVTHLPTCAPPTCIHSKPPCHPAPHPLPSFPLPAPNSMLTLH